VFLPPIDYSTGGFRRESINVWECSGNNRTSCVKITPPLAYAKNAPYPIMSMSSPTIGQSLKSVTISPPQRRSQTSDSAASAAERDAQGRVTQAEQSVENAQLDANKKLDNIREQYDEKSEVQEANLEDAVEHQKMKGYEQLRDLKRAQEAELRRVKMEGDRELAKESDYYRDTTYATYRKGEQDLTDLRQKQAVETNYTQKSGTIDFDAQKNEQERRLADLKQTEDFQYNEVNNQRLAKYEKLKADTETANQRTTDHFQASYKAVLDQDQASLDLINGKATHDINAIRADTSQKLSAYSDRQNDPFYKMKDIAGQLHEYNDKFVLTANIPRHEQDHVTVALRGNELVVSGTRRNEEKLEVSPGHSKGTSSYQSFEESFPLSWPVEGHQLMKEFNGDRLIVTIPKASQFASKGTYKAPGPQRLRAERPQFPGNLPTSESIKDPTPEKPPGSIPLA
jgi:HSP20 family molecular chaperone IbpA